MFERMFGFRYGIGLMPILFFVLSILIDRQIKYVTSADFNFFTISLYKTDANRLAILAGRYLRLAFELSTFISFCVKLFFSTKLTFH